MDTIRNHRNLETQSREILGHLYDVAGLGMCVPVTQRRFVAVNGEYCKTYGYSPSELIGKEFTMVVAQEERDAAARLHDDFLLREKGEVSGEWRVVRKEGSVCTILVTALREVAHRVTNHLKSLQSMLTLQLRESEGETKVVSILTDSINWIKSMSRLYDRLQRDPSVATVGLREYLETLISDIVSTGGREGYVDVQLDTEDFQITIEQGVSLGLILNELATNSLKHAIPEGTPGWISVSVKSAGTHIEARISDSGPGVSADYLDQTRGRIGMQIVTAIVSQHSGEFVLEDPDSSLFLVRLPRILR